MFGCKSAGCPDITGVCTDGINDYFIHFDYLDSKCWNDWIELSINTKLAIKFETEDNRRKAIEVHIIEE